MFITSLVDFAKSIYIIKPIRKSKQHQFQKQLSYAHCYGIHESAHPLASNRHVFSVQWQHPFLTLDLMNGSLALKEQPMADVVCFGVCLQWLEDWAEDADLYPISNGFHKLHLSYSFDRRCRQGFGSLEHTYLQHAKSKNRAHVICSASFTPLPCLQQSSIWAVQVMSWKEIMEHLGSLEPPTW